MEWARVRVVRVPRLEKGKYSKGMGKGYSSYGTASTRYVS